MRDQPVDDAAADSRTTQNAGKKECKKIHRCQLKRKTEKEQEQWKAANKGELQRP